MATARTTCWLALTGCALMGACGTPSAPMPAPQTDPVSSPTPEALAPDPASPLEPQPSPQEPEPAPRATPTLVDRPRLALGESGAIAIGHDGAVYTFSLDPGADSARASRVAGVAEAQAVAAGYRSYCVVTTAHQTWCWSDGDSRSRELSATPAAIAGLAGAEAVVMFSPAVCIRDAAGAVRCLGRTGHPGAGQVRAVTLPAPAIQIAAASGGYHLAALLEDRRVFVVESGQEPRLIYPPFAVSAITMHGDDLCVLSADGEGVACEGQGLGQWYYEDVDFEDDEMGPVSAMAAPVPMRRVDGTNGALAVAMNLMAGCAVLAGGTLRCWGASYRDGRREGFRSVPAPGLRGLTEVVAGGYITRGVVCGVAAEALSCFSTPARLGTGTPGSPPFSICLPGDGCTPLRLGARDAAGRIEAASATDVAALPSATDVAALAITPDEARSPGCSVADASGTPLRVRAEPSVRAEVVGELPNGTQVVIAERRGRFAHLTSPVIGWAWVESIACRE